MKTAGQDPMTKAQAIKAKSDARRKALSPELREVLHMLKSLEAELDARQSSTR
jgi:hypothetical protein